MCAEAERTDISRCGNSWVDANRRCSTVCSVDDGACVIGTETCWVDLKRSCEEGPNLPLILGLCVGAVVLLLLTAFCCLRASPPFNLQKQMARFYVFHPVIKIFSIIYSGPEYCSE